MLDQSLVYAGEQDTVAPITQALQLTRAPAPVEIRRVPGAGHFSFMNVLPPGMSDSPGFDRDAFLADLAEETLHFLTEAHGAMHGGETIPA
ncbi:MAG TPA: hypothetical protein VES42_07260 [Pilimelia sp.]|nr:hypothetical protein [Pilimelia sp.]